MKRIILLVISLVLITFLSIGLANSQDKNKELELNNSNLSIELETSNETIDVMEIVIEEKDTEINNIRLLFNEKSEALTSTELELSEVEQELITKNTELETIQAEKTKLQEEKQTLQEELDSLKDEYYLNLETIQQKEEEISLLNEQVHNLTMDRNDLTSQVNELTLQRDNLETSYSELINEKEALQSRIFELEAQIDELQNSPSTSEEVYTIEFITDTHGIFPLDFLEIIDVKNGFSYLIEGKSFGSDNSISIPYEYDVNLCLVQGINIEMIESSVYEDSLISIPSEIEKGNITLNICSFAGQMFGSISNFNFNALLLDFNKEDGITILENSIYSDFQLSCSSKEFYINAVLATDISSNEFEFILAVEFPTHITVVNSDRTFEDIQCRYVFNFVEFTSRLETIYGDVLLEGDLIIDNSSIEYIAA